MGQLLPAYMDMIKKNSQDIVFNPDFFEERETKAIKNCPKIRAVKPIISYTHSKIKLGYNVGTRGNGQDQPRWPDDLMVDIVE